MSWELFSRVPPSLAHLLAAAALLVLGAVLGRVLASWSQRGVRASLDRVARRPSGIARGLAPVLLEAVPVLVSRFVYWGIWLVAAAAALEQVGVQVVGRIGERLERFLPGAFAGAGLVVVGAVVASLVGGAVAAAVASSGARYAGAAGRLAQGTLLVLAVLLGLEQVGVHGELIAALLAGVLAVGVGGAALAFGLGARVAVGNIVASYYVAQTYRVGQRVRVGELEGRILRATPIGLVLDTGGGEAFVPASLFCERPSLLVPEEV